MTNVERGFYGAGIRPEDQPSVSAGAIRMIPQFRMTGTKGEDVLAVWIDPNDPLFKVTITTPITNPSMNGDAI